MNTLAKRTLRRAISNSHYIDSTFPWEPLQFRIQGNKVLCSPTKAIQETFTRQTTRLFYDSKNIISSSDFDLVYWDGLKRVMALWPLTVRAGYSKILAKFIGVNHFLHQISHGKINAKCPCRLHPNETTEHIILRQNSARTALYHGAVDKLGQWMGNQ